MTRQELEKRSMAFAVQVTGLCEELRKKPIAWSTAGQLLDAATSMAANYRATARSRSRAEWISIFAASYATSRRNRGKGRSPDK